MPSECGMNRILLSLATPVTIPSPEKFSERKLIVSLLALVRICRSPASHMKSSCWLPEVAAEMSEGAVDGDLETGPPPIG